MIGKHLRTPLRNQLGLILHILPAPGDEQKRGDAGENESPSREKLCSPTLATRSFRKDGAPGTAAKPAQAVGGWKLKAKS
jgi:hypothetical protein